MRRLLPALPVLVLLVAPPVLLGTLWLDPLSAGEDDVGYYFPLRVMVGRALREGRWPVENPLEATSAPLLADPQSAVMHPATWLFAAPPGGETLAYTLSLMIGFWLAGGGAYLYLRRLGLVRSAALFGTVAFQFCGFLIGHRVHLSILLTAAMMPWGLWIVERMRREGPVRGSGRGDCGGPRGLPMDHCPLKVEQSRSPVEATRPIDNGQLSTVNGPGRNGWSWRSAILWLVPILYLAITAGHWPTLIHMGMIWLAYLLLRARPLGRALATCVAAGVLAALLTGPQVLATADLLGQVTRQKIGYAMAGENSFFPAAGALALFPFLMGNRTPNFFAQPWWGPWNQCEMLGYVGLATLALAGAAIWKLYRAKGLSFSPLVRAWTWIAAGAFVWMLGYYLPTYRLIHMIPVLGILRCPARMVLAVDFAMATLAAIAIHVVVAGRQTGSAPSQSESDRDASDHDVVSEAVRRTTLVALPLTMVATLALLAAAAWALRALGWWGTSSPFTVGGSSDALSAVNPLNPAVWVPAGLWAVSAAATIWWLRSPARRPAALVVVILADLFVLARFVDVPANVTRADPFISPAAAWLKEHADRERVAGASPAETATERGRDALVTRGQDARDTHGQDAHATHGQDARATPYRVWGLSPKYFHRQAELLLPKTNCLFDIATIASYGPFQSPAHAHLLGFNICGYNRDWADLLRRNALLSLYNVRYILCEANSEFEEVLRSVRVSATQPQELGPNLVDGIWEGRRVEIGGGTWTLQTPWMWSKSEAHVPVVLEPNTIYRISLEARGPEGGAANFLRADVYHKGKDYSWYQPEKWGLTVPPEQIVANWRLFRWTFETDGNVPSPLNFRLMTLSERPIEVRRLSLRKLSQWESPEDCFHFSPGRQAYLKVAELLPRRLTSPPVVIYENLLVGRRGIARGWPKVDESRVESIKWFRNEYPIHIAMPHVGLDPPLPLEEARRFLHHEVLHNPEPGVVPEKAMSSAVEATTVPGVLIYIVFLLLAVRGRNNRRDPRPAKWQADPQDGAGA